MKLGLGKKIIALALTLAMLLALAPASVAAAAAVEGEGYEFGHVILDQPGPYNIAANGHTVQARNTGSDWTRDYLFECVISNFNRTGTIRLMVGHMGGDNNFYMEIGAGSNVSLSSGGNLGLNWFGQGTAPVAWNSNPASVKYAMEVIGPTITLLVNDTRVYSYTVTDADGLAYLAEGGVGWRSNWSFGATFTISNIKVTSLASAGDTGDPGDPEPAPDPEPGEPDGPYDGPVPFNLIPNGDFSQGADGWTAVNDAAGQNEVRDDILPDKNVYRIGASSGGVEQRLNVGLKRQTTYVATSYARRVGTNNTSPAIIGVDLDVYGQRAITLNDAAGATNWAARGQYFTVEDTDSEILNRAFATKNNASISVEVGEIGLYEAMLVKDMPFKTSYALREPIDLSGLNLWVYNVSKGIYEAMPYSALNLDVYVGDTNTLGTHTIVVGLGTGTGDGHANLRRLTIDIEVVQTPGGVPVAINDVGGAYRPINGRAPVSVITDTDEYSGTVTWSPDHATFQPGVSYTAEILLTVKPGYTLDGLSAGFFKVPGATSVKYEAVAENETAGAEAAFTLTGAADPVESGGMLTAAGEGGAERGRITAVFPPPSAPAAMRDLDAFDFVADMKTGWNLGNTFDALSDDGNAEGAWVAIYTTKPMIDGLKHLGFDTLRVPISWDTGGDGFERVGPAPDYKVADWFLARVEEIVNWAVVDNDMYIILNAHHDQWLYELNGYAWDSPTVVQNRQKAAAIWRQVAEYFKDYGDKLIFEPMNEPGNWESSGGSAQGRTNVNNYNQLLVNSIRSGGGNSDKRFIMCATYAGSTSNANIDAFVTPATNGSPDRRIIGSIHSYAPTAFCASWSGLPGSSNLTRTMSQANINDLNQVAVQFARFTNLTGLPAILGEYGSLNKTDDPTGRTGNTEARADHAYRMLTNMQNISVNSSVGRPGNTYKTIGVWWDDYMFYDNADNEPFGIYDRANSVAWFPEIVDSIMKAAYGPGGYEDPSEYGEMRDITATEFVKEIKLGWSLGNSLDAYNRTSNSSGANFPETSWISILTSKAIVQGLADAGFNTLRIPITWSGATGPNSPNRRIGPAPNYTVLPSFLDRVEQIVDWALESGMHVIINSHHDDWQERMGENQPGDEALVTALWSQVAERFKKHGDKLIFEVMNEPDDPRGWWSGNEASWEAVNHYNQIMVNAIRAAGGNNAKRFIMIPTNSAGTSSDHFGTLKMPEDQAGPDKIIVSVHSYAPTPFTFPYSGPPNWSSIGSRDTHIVVDDEDYALMDATMYNIYERFTSRGIPVILGEMGAIVKWLDPVARGAVNTAERAAYAEYFVRGMKMIGVPVVWWDNNMAAQTSNEPFHLYDRATAKIVYPEIMQAMVDAAYSDTVFQASVVYDKEESKWRIKAVLKNDCDGGEIYSGTISALTPAGIVLNNDIEYNGLKPGETIERYFDINPEFDFTSETEVITLNYTAADETKGAHSDGKRPVTVRFRAVDAYHVAEPFAIDGDMKKAPWKNMADAVSLRDGLMEVSKGAYGPASAIESGDLSATAKLAWDSENMYIAVEVTDDAHYNPYSGANINKGDSLSVILGRPEEARVDDYGYSRALDLGSAEMGFALTDGGVQAWSWANTPLWANNEPGAIPPEFAAVSVVRDEAAKKTYYEIALKWDYLYMECDFDGKAMEIGDFGFITLAVNDFDGASDAGKFAEYGAGLNVGVKNVGRLQLLLADEYANGGVAATAGIRTEETAYLGGQAAFMLALSGENMVTVEADITVDDGDKLSFDRIEPADGFSVMSGADGAPIAWTPLDGGAWKGTATLVYTAGGDSNGFTSAVPEDVAAFYFNTLATGPAIVKLTGVRIYGLEEEGGAIELFQSEIAQDTAVTDICIWYSPYDLNRDGKVDVLDLSIAALYCQFNSDDAGWQTFVKTVDSFGIGITADMCDVNGDGEVNMLDLVEIYLNYTN